MKINKGIILLVVTVLIYVNLININFLLVLLVTVCILLIGEYKEQLNKLDGRIILEIFFG
jgi:hypothetical protein